MTSQATPETEAACTCLACVQRRATTIAHASAACEALERYMADLCYPCGSLGCHSKRGQPCVGVPIGKVHESRRIRRLRAS
jgi:hypothetical protein